MVVEVLPCNDCFITCMGAHFPAVELDNVIWFSTFTGCQSSCGIVPNGPAMLACSIDQNLNYVTTMLQLDHYLSHYVMLQQLFGGWGEMLQLFGCISCIEQCSPLALMLSSKFPGKMCKFLGSLNDFLWPFFLLFYL